MEDNLILSRYSLELVKTLSKGSDLQALVDLGYQMLGNPFTITDLSVKLLASTGETLVTDDPVWNELQINNNFNFETYSYYVKESLFDEIAKHEEPFFWLDPYCKYPRIIGEITINKRNVAVLVACAHNQEFRESDKEIVSILCDAFSIELQKNKYNHLSQGLLHQSFLLDLLDDKFKDESKIDERLKILGLKLKRKLFVIFLDTQNFDATKSTLPYLREEVELKLANASAVIYNNNIAILASCENEMHFLENESKVLREFMITNNLQAGISRSFTDLTEVRDHYLESVEALKLGNLVKKETHFFSYADYLIYDLINCHADNENYIKFLHRSMLKLIDYDKKNGTEFVHSFHIYLRNFKNIKDSATALNIHRNTMFYRIEKIESILNVDLNDVDILFQLYLSYKILEMTLEVGV
ncbi:CdaR family transcriptional regulator [Desulfosporosinus sp. BICA1-9]|uniref:PucR family transcriptional regulator n=1 Tax=Desulfosporosinus sp. BICA1-9 TaxID=1531958 RepID=UPI00054BA35D|nr:helix-turn-helix domain-containing protein [Desulfosporosinus sp. BICA1-9]KJS46738.1 MAG: PucR family transcriptional regulator [Peptococcaceae bacterium BRH_c23]KJS85601.1 MAG: PucR family transcriptional regulator [Desulfosporosinus sp. BICA1-9]HBW34127.1 PucR family transcriptional regulator [Desulfosporosinus sp.]